MVVATTVVSQAILPELAQLQRVQVQFQVVEVSEVVVEDSVVGSFHVVDLLADRALQHATSAADQIISPEIVRLKQ